jgi:hypothetical protein
LTRLVSAGWLILRNPDALEKLPVCSIACRSLNQSIFINHTRRMLLLPDFTHPVNNPLLCKICIMSMQNKQLLNASWLVTIKKKGQLNE